MKLLIAIVFFISTSLFANEPNRVLLATTTSTDNSGLLAYLLPIFEKKYKLKVLVLAAGTGKTLKLAERGDVDIVMVHAKEKELEFVEDGFGIDRKDLMYNDFVIVGPLADDAKISGEKDIINVFRKIAQNNSVFISRGDESGTHIKEKYIWQSSKINTNSPWYMQAGQGMGKTLQIANELKAYTITDRGTWLKMKPKLQNLIILYQNNDMLFNPYGIMLVNPAKHPHRNYAKAKLLQDWLVSKESKQLINNYRIDGQQLFYSY